MINCDRSPSSACEETAEIAEQLGLSRRFIERKLKLIREEDWSGELQQDD